MRRGAAAAVAAGAEVSNATRQGDDGDDDEDKDEDEDEDGTATPAATASRAAATAGRGRQLKSEMLTPARSDKLRRRLATLKSASSGLTCGRPPPPGSGASGGTQPRGAISAMPAASVRSRSASGKRPTCKWCSPQRIFVSARIPAHNASYSQARCSAALKLGARDAHEVIQEASPRVAANLQMSVRALEGSSWQAQAASTAKVGNARVAAHMRKARIACSSAPRTGQSVCSGPSEVKASKSSKYRSTSMKAV
mmetsp:Transcript_85112/g.244293  ORF Transcript_85112/g.244293 Transcript_85112/m.244293 type:complete len:253 (-) Transcript_85112:196-954(-)